MVTFAPPRLLNLARQLESAVPSAVFSGIVPDSSHIWGFHVSPEDLGWNRGDYSLANDDNWAGAQLYPEWGSAFDMSMSPSDMTLIHGRIRASWTDPADDRLSYWYEHIGAINGVVSRLVSYEPEWGEFFDSDGTHTWHEHTSARRSQLDNQLAMDALYSVWAGEENVEMTIGGESESDYFTRIERALWWPIPGIASGVSRMEAAVARLEAAAGSRQLTLTDEQVDRLAKALVETPDVPLGERDIPAIVAGVKRALSEGVTG